MLLEEEKKGELHTTYQPTTTHINGALVSVLEYSPRNLCFNVAVLKEIGTGVSGPEKCGERVHREDNGVDAGGLA